MNGKGTEFTIFQGAPSLHVDNNQQRVEEEEAVQDQIRRNQELGNELHNAFEDLDDDDDDANDTMNSTKHSHGNSIHNHSKIPKFINHQHYQPQQPFPLRDQETHLRNLLETRSREIDYVTSQLTAERQKNKSIADEFEKRLAIAEAEKERALMTREQTHELLVETKGKVIVNEEKAEKLRSRMKSLETENSKLVGELESTKLMLTDIQIKYNMVEKNVMFSADRNTDNILKQAQERHSAQIAMMQQQMDTLKSKYDDMEHEHKNLEIRYKEMQRNRESVLIEKSETINHLNKNLEEAQRQCQDLLSRPNLAQENRQLQSVVRTIESQKEEMHKTIRKLEKTLEDQSKEMEIMDSVVQECGGINGSFSESTKFIHRDPLKNKNSSTPIAPEARLARVKDELCKSLNNIKNKREEIKICEQQLREKDEEIKQLKMDENKALVQMNQYRDEKIRLESKTKILEKELEKVRQESLHRSKSHDCVTDAKYEEKIKNLQLQKEGLETELNNIKTCYERLSMKNGELMENDKEWCEKVEFLEREMETLKDTEKVAQELNAEREKVKELQDKIKSLEVDKKVEDNLAEFSLNKSARNITNSCLKCDEYSLKLEKLQDTCLQLQNVNTEHLSELNKMKQELASATREIDTLEEKLNLKGHRDQEIEKLKQKAQEFEEFMRGNRNASAASSSESTSTTKTNVSTETSDLGEKKTHKASQHAETKIRDEMAKIFAFEMKTKEKSFREEIGRLQNRIILITEELDEKTQELSVRNEQLQLLKYTILEEREEAERRLHEKDDDFKVAIEKYRAEHENNQQKIEDLMSQMRENKEMIEEERLSIETLKRQITEERASLVKREQEVMSNFKRLESDGKKLVNELNEKYVSAKRTAMNYKQYSEDKENHFRKEYERTKAACVEAVEKVRVELKETLSQKEQTYQEKLKKMESEYDFKVEILKGMLKKT